MVKRYFSNSVFISTVIIVFIFYSGIFTFNVSRSFYSLMDKNLITQITGKIENSPVKCGNGKYYSAKIKINEICYKNGIKSTSSGFIETYIPSNLIEAYFPGKLYTKSNSSNNCLYEEGGIYTLTGNYNNNIFFVKDCIANFWNNDFSGKFYYLRALSRLQFKRLMYSWGDSGGLILALLSGAKEYSDSSLTKAFKDSGLSHILALSGMHLSLFSGIALFVGKKTKRKKLSYLIRLISLYLFIWFAGISPSLLRAYICSMLLLIASIINEEKQDMLLILCFSFVLQINLCPYDIYNVGFLLSYGALAGILLFSNTINILLIKKLPYYLSSSLSSSISANTFTIPISIKIFGTFSPIGIIATTFVSPLITIFIYSGLFLIILSMFFPFIAIYSGIFMNFLYTIIKYSVFFFSKAPIWSIN